MHISGKYTQGSICACSRAGWLLVVWIHEWQGCGVDLSLLLPEACTALAFTHMYGPKRMGEHALHLDY